MTAEEILEYSNKYKKHQLILTKVFMVLLIVLGLCFLGFGIFFCFDKRTELIIIGVIMIIAGLLNVVLGFKFNLKSSSIIKNMPNEKAAKKYMNIYGIKK